MTQDDSQILSRRELLTLPGAGLILLFPVASLPAAQQPRQGYPTDFNAYLRVGEDGRVTCMVGKVELGQGSKTALAQLLAEELDVAFDSVDMVMGDTEMCPWDMGTFGSLSIRQFGPILRAGAAEARAVLLTMASEYLGTPVDRLQVSAGVVTAPQKTVTYGELVHGKRIERHLSNVPLKTVAAYKVVGRSPQRKDAIEKITGKAKFAGDIVLPAMLHARLLRPPAHGAVLKEVDTSAAEKVDGVRIVREGDLVAALHERPDVADKAVRLIKARFDHPQTGVNDETIFDHLLKTAAKGELVHEAGNLGEGEKLATTIVEATYFNSYVAHAATETHSAVARVEGGKATIWAGTQTPFPLQQQVAQALGLPAESVRVITPYVGGGFGGKSASLQAIEAARLAKITGRPVQVVWDRAEEFFYDRFRPAAVVKIRSGLTSDGKIPLWDFTVYCAGDREANQFYDIPHQRTASAGGWGGNPPNLHPFAVGPWRAPAVNTNTFARESHIDVLAAKAHADPLEFRLRHLSDQRMRRVLEAAAKQFGWKPSAAPSGKGVGVSCAIYLGTWIAMMAQVDVNRKTGHVQVQRVVCALDQGVTVNPDGSRQQIEGGIIMALGSALTEEVRFRDGVILDRNFDTYEISRFSWVPKIETVLIDNRETPSSGCGKPPVVNVGPVIANAIFDAVGLRLVQLPMTPARILKALATT